MLKSSSEMGPSVSNALRFTSHTSCVNMEGVRVLSVHEIDEIVNPARQRLYESAGALSGADHLSMGRYRL